MIEKGKAGYEVSTHSRLKAAGYYIYYTNFNGRVSTHSRLKAAGTMPLRFANICIVSTHSRLKAAGWILSMRTEKDTSFNTQPPEGGWAILPITKCCMICFNTQPPEGGWVAIGRSYNTVAKFQHTAA